MVGISHGVSSVTGPLRQTSATLMKASKDWEHLYFTEALATALRLEPGDDRDLAYRHIARTAKQAGRYKLAIEAIEQISDPSRRAGTYLDLLTP